MFFGVSQVIRGHSLAKGPRAESSLPQALLKSKEGWPGGLLKDRSGAQALIPLLKRVNSFPFLVSLDFKQEKGVELSFPERKVRGWGPA